METNKFLKKYESNEPQITKYFKELQTALRERLSEKEAPKGFLSWFGMGYKPLSNTADDYDERRTVEQAKKNPRKPT